MYLIEGLFLGFASILLVGPVVFVLINASVQSGIKSGMAVALGIIAGDIIYTIATFKSIDFITENETFNQVMAYAGFIILFLVGLSYALKKQLVVHQKVNTTKKGLLKYFLSGFSINFFNPFVLGVWLMVVNYAKTSQAEHSVSYLIAVLSGIFIIDSVKVFLSKKLKGYINSNKLNVFYKVSGVIMILFSLRILFFIMKS